MQIDTITAFYSLKTYTPCTKINSEIFYRNKRYELTSDGKTLKRYTVRNESRTIVKEFDDIVPHFTIINGRAYILCKKLYENIATILNMDFKLVKTFNLDDFRYVLSNNDKLYIVSNDHINILTFDANLDIASSKTISSIGKSIYLTYKSWLIASDATELVFYDDLVNEVFRISLTTHTTKWLASETHIYIYNDYIAIDPIGNYTILVYVTDSKSFTIELKHNNLLV